MPDSRQSPLPEPLLSALDTVRFVDKPAALKRIAGLRQSVPDTELLDLALRRLLLTLGEVAVADACLVSFERFWHRTDDPFELARFFTSQPRAIEILVKLFVGSQYLTETLLKHPEYLKRLTQHRQLAEMKSREDFIVEARQSWSPQSTLSERLDALRQYQRWEILRVGACDAFALMDLRSATNQLSLLADAMVGVCLGLVSEACQQPPDILCVVGMGKLGGEELNYSSDIDLIFLTETPGVEAVTVGQRLVKALQDQTQEGFLYRVDLRLRPWGRSGELVSTVAGHLDYLGTHAELWERQALLKARVIAGKQSLGRELLQRSQGIIFSASAASVRGSIRTAKQRIEADLHRRGRGWGEVKAGAGSIRDVEFVVQCLQLSHGGKLPHVRTPNTLDGLIRLADTGLLAADEYRQLSGGYLFLRTIEHALQLAHNKQLHTLPSDPRELQSLARRLDFSDAESFVLHYEQHCQAIRGIYSRRLEEENQRATFSTETLPFSSWMGGPFPSNGSMTPVDLGNTELSAFSPAEQAEHARCLQLVTERQPVKVLATPLPENLWRVTVLGIDGPGDLSLICGLLFVYGFNIRDGIVTTGQHPLCAQLYQEPRWSGTVGRRTLRDFVDVFTVQGPYDGMIPEVWHSYEADLLELLLLLRHGKAGEAQGRLAKRVARALEGPAQDPHHLLPVQIDLDNSISERGTALQIQAEDTLGFLYELTNALALSGIDIEEVIIRSNGNRVFDTLIVTDAQQGGKILDRQRLEELRAAVILIKQFTHLLPRSPNPEAALFHFRAFVQELFRRPDWMEELSSLERPDVLDALAQLLGVSDFLWEDFLRLQHSNLFPVLRDLSSLQTAHSRNLLAAQLQSLTASTDSTIEWRKTLNEFKDREMFRVDMRHILGQIDRFEQFSAELTAVAEVVVEAAAKRGYQQLVDRFGVPTGPQEEPCRWSVCALGKFGGLELGFASDIELMFLFDTDGHTTDHSTDQVRGPAQTQVIANAEFFQRWVELFTQSIEARHEGIFHLDLRLRPYGRSGPLAVPLEAFWKYFCTEGPAWPFERQALVKLRPIAGDPELGQQIMSVRDQAVYTGHPFDFSAMRALRERQLHQLVRAGTMNAKLSPGGLVDVEYLVQGLQISHGHEFPALRTTNTLQAIEELASASVFTTGEAESLSGAYRFWRRLIDALRMVRGNARDLTVPAAGTEEFEFLGRRLGGTLSETPWELEIERQSQVVIGLSRRYEPERPGA